MEPAQFGSRAAFRIQQTYCLSLIYNQATMADTKRTEIIILHWPWERDQVGFHHHQLYFIVMIIIIRAAFFDLIVQAYIPSSSLSYHKQLKKKFL